jgi:hypothetical protein
MNRFQTLLYPPVTLLDVARDDGNVAVVYDRGEVEDRHIQARVVASEEVGGAAYPLRAEAGPALKVAPVSNGAPTIAASAFARSRAFGRRMKVRTSEKHGVSKESAGSYRVKRFSFGLGSRLRLRFSDNLRGISLRRTKLTTQRVGHQDYDRAGHARYQQGTLVGDDEHRDEDREHGSDR